MQLGHGGGVADGQAVERGVVERNQNAAVDRGGGASAPAASGRITGAAPNARTSALMSGSKVIHSSRSTSTADRRNDHQPDQACRHAPGRRQPIRDRLHGQPASSGHHDHRRAVQAQHLDPRGDWRTTPMRRRSLVKWISGMIGERQLHAEDHLAQDQQSERRLARPRDRW